MVSAIIETKRLTKKFDDITAVDGLTFRINKGEVFGLLGPNGAGKTTTVRMLACLISKTSGEAQVGGYDISNEPDSLKLRKIIGILPENTGLYDKLSAYKNIDFYGKLYGCPEQQRKENIERLLKMLGLWEKRDVLVGGFSKGMKQKVAIARALVHDPEILFLDEPTASLDPEAAKTVRDFILRLKKEKRTIFLNTHNLDEAQRICDRIGILKTKLLAIGTPKQLERSAWSSKIEFKLESVGRRVLAAVKKLKPDSVKVSGNKLIVGIAFPEKENPLYVKAIVSAGGKIRFVSEISPSLEDVYLKTVGRTK